METPISSLKEQLVTIKKQVAETQWNILHNEDADTEAYMNLYPKQLRQQFEFENAIEILERK